MISISAGKKDELARTLLDETREAIEAIERAQLVYDQIATDYIAGDVDPNIVVTVEDVIEDLQDRCTRLCNAVKWVPLVD